MTRLSLLMLSLLLAFGVGVACSGGATGGGSGTTVPPAATYYLSLSGTSASTLSGKIADFRVIDHRINSVMYCATAQIAASGSFQFSSYAFGPVGLDTKTAELVLNTDADAAFGAGDYHYSFTDPLVGTSFSINFNFLAVAQSAVTWSPGQACPGQ